MEKEQSIIIKGIAILMLLFYHLFGIDNINELCKSFIYIKHLPLAHYLSNAAYPVSFFLILSGYGLTYVYNHQGLNISKQLKRISKIYVNYWIILAIYISLAAYVRPGYINTDLLHVICNVTAFYCTWNGEVWFLFPYTMLSLTAIFIIRKIYSLTTIKRTFTYTLLYIAVFVLLKLIPFPEQRRVLICYMQVIYYIQLLFYFSLGVFMYIMYDHKEVVVATVRKHVPHALKPYHINTICALLAIMTIKSLFKITIADGIYAFIFILLFNRLQINKHLRKALMLLGKYSMQMWMIHTILCVYLFQDFIYGFKYPIIIFAILVIASFISAYAISKVTNKVITIMFSTVFHSSRENNDNNA